MLGSRLYAFCPNLPVLVLHSTGVSNYVAASMSVKARRRRPSSALNAGLTQRRKMKTPFVRTVN